MVLTLAEIAEMVGGSVHGDSTIEITGVNGLKEAAPGELSFVRDAKYAGLLADTRASAVLIDHVPENVATALVVVSKPDLAFAQVLQRISSHQIQHPVGIHETAVVGENVQLGEGVALDAHVRIAEDVIIGEGAVLYAGTYIGRGSRIGAGTVIYANVSVREFTEIGRRCIIHTNAAIGSDGFGFAPLGGQWMKIPQVGRVILEDDVEIGSNSCVDRATFGVTRIGRGTKIDNLVQVGHNVEIGEHCAIAGKVGIAGSARLANHVQVGAQAGVKGHLLIGEGATVAARAGVIKDVAPGAVVSGFPAIDHQQERRIMVAQLRLPELLRRMKQLERRLDALHEESNDE